MSYGDVAVASESTYRQLIDSIVEYAVIRLDTQGTVRGWNPGGERLLGYSSGEIIGRPFGGFYTEDDVRAGQAEKELRTAVRDGRCEVEGWRVRKDGSRFWASVVISPIRESDGELIGYVKVARDLSERREQEQ